MTLPESRLEGARRWIERAPTFDYNLTRGCIENGCETCNAIGQVIFESWAGLAIVGACVHHTCGKCWVCRRVMGRNL